MSSTDSLLKTPLDSWHRANGGRMVEFGGWSMPVQYTSISEEHEAVRQRVGLFDISHMGRLRFDGPDAVNWLQQLTTNDVTRLSPGRIQYSLICQEDGGVIDDILVYHLNEGDGYGLVCNASNRQEVVSFFESRRGALDSTLADSTLETAMIAIQGPAALSTLQTIFDAPGLERLKPYRHIAGRVLGTNASASRTGYTGEDGFELIVHRDLAEATWLALLEAGRERGILPCGLGARDTLRFEAAMPLYGHELSRMIHPYAVGLGAFVKLDKGPFSGSNSLSKLKEQPGLTRIGLELEGRRIARQDSPVVWNDQVVGRVTSGTLSPTLQKNLAMAVVGPQFPEIGTALEIEIRGRRTPAKVVPLPFYSRPRTH